MTVPACVRWVRVRLRLSLRLLAFSLLAPACAPLDRSIAESTLDAAEWNFVVGLDVPVVRGTEGCGAQALATVLAFHDARIDATDRAEALPWHDAGATPVDLLLAARDDGFLAQVHAGDWALLAAAVEAGTPPLVMFDAAPVVPTLTGAIPTPSVMHWGVVSGVERNGERVLIANTAQRHHPVPRDDFLERWARADHCTILIAAQVPRSGAK